MCGQEHHELTVFLPAYLVEYANKRAEEMDVSISTVVAFALGQDRVLKERALDSSPLENRR